MNNFISEHNTRISKLTKLLAGSYKVKFPYHHEDKRAEDADLLWDASRFWAHTIKLSVPSFEGITYDDFLAFKTHYQLGRSVQIDADTLFNKFWLRNVLTFVRIPAVINSATYQFAKMKGIKSQLDFIYDFYKTIPDTGMINRSVPESELDLAIANHLSTTGNSIDKDVLQKAGVFSNNKGSIRFSAMEHYFEPILDHWDEFDFLNALSEKVRSLQSGNLINKVQFEEHHFAFSNLFNKTPPINELVLQRAISDEGDYYRINLDRSEIRYGSAIGERIAGHYWQLLADDLSLGSNEARVLMFLKQPSYFEDQSQFLSAVTETARRKFLDGAFSLVRKDPDLFGAKVEFEKVFLDTESGGIAYLSPDAIRRENFTLDNSDYFELLESLNNWDDVTHTDYLHRQRSRSSLSFLLKIIVRYDAEFVQGVPPNRYNRIFTLLRDGKEKPFLLWEITRYLMLFRREAICDLIYDRDFCSLAFQLFDELEFPEEKIRSEELLTIWSEGLDLALCFVASFDHDDERRSKIIFQIFRQINLGKYRLIGPTKTKQVEKLLRKERRVREEILISKIENALLQSFKGGPYKYLIPEIFNSLVIHFENLRIKRFADNGTVEFPMLQWGGLVWLMKLSTSWKYRTQFHTERANIHKITNIFFKLYLERIEITEVDKFNYSEKKTERGVPYWGEKLERLDLIEWIYPMLFINRAVRLNSFLEPRFIFDTAEDRYHKMNNFTADKLRTHIGVLVHVLGRISMSSVPYGFDRKDLIDIKSKIENQIVAYIKTHSKDVPAEARIDLFNFTKEWGIYSSGKEALLPQIARSINLFADKEPIIEAIVQSEDIIKILTTADFITSEGIRKRLLERIRQSNMLTFLGGSHWIPEIESAFLKIMKYPELATQIEQTITFWENRIVTRDKKYEEQLYSAKLLMAYFHNNEAELEQVVAPSAGSSHHDHDLGAKERKAFYRGLLQLKTDPLAAYNTFNKLIEIYPQYPVLAVNRMAAQIDMANQNNDQNIYREALEEWNEYERRNADIDKEFLGSVFYVNKLVVLLKLSEFDQLDSLYGQLDLSLRMQIDILEPKLQSLVERDKFEEAMQLLDSAEDYHIFYGDVATKFIEDFRDRINGIDNIDELRTQYNRIFNCNPVKLIRIFPDRLNGQVDLSEFIVKEVALSAGRMLNKINSISAIKTENKMNDLVQLALESRVSPWGWTVKDQTRKGFSPSSKELGEIDLDIQDSNNESFVTCEAFILRSKKVVQSHLEKMIADYTHQRRSFIVIVYSLGPQSRFESDWKRYSELTMPGVNCPVGYEMIEKKLIDLTKVFGFESTAIKIGKANHGTNTNLFHVFINVNFTVAVPKARNKKGKPKQGAVKKGTIKKTAVSKITVKRKK